MNKILIVVDAQEDFTRGTLRNEEAIKALPVIHNIVEYAKSVGMHILYTQDTHYDNYLETQEGKNLPIKHCKYLSKGWQLCPEVKVENYPTYLLYKSAFGSSDWSNNPVATAAEVWICGFCTDICVSANFQTIKAFYPELPITVISDACAGVTPELHEAALKVMKSCQARVIEWEKLKKENIK